MAITIGNGNVNINTDFKAITDIQGKLAKTGIQFDGSNVRISAREMFLKKVTNRLPKGHIAGLMPKSMIFYSLVQGFTAKEKILKTSPPSRTPPAQFWRF